MTITATVQISQAGKSRILLATLLLLGSLPGPNVILPSGAGAAVHRADNSLAGTQAAVHFTGHPPLASGFAGSAARSSVPGAPTIISAPQSQSVDLWQSARFTVTASGDHLSYQWRKNGFDLVGETNSAYALDHVSTNHANDSFTVLVSNPSGSVTTAPPAVLTVNRPSPGAVVMCGTGTPYPVPASAQAGVIAVVSASFFEFPSFTALKADRSVVAWGDFEFSDRLAKSLIPQDLAEVTAIAGGIFHVAALKRDGTVAAWGYNASGQVTGTTNELVTSTNPLTFGSQPLTGVVALAAHWNHTVALKNDGTIAAWGLNSSGQVTGVPFADGSPVAIANPVTFDGQVLTNVRSIAVGRTHTVALKGDGTVAAWGYNENGEVTGTASTQSLSAIANPVTLDGKVLREVVAIAVGDANLLGEQDGGYTIALKSDGTVVAWGENRYGETRLPDGLSGVSAITAGYGRTLALKNDGTVAAWGFNGNGEVSGSPSSEDSSRVNSVVLDGEILSGVRALAIGPTYSVALKKDGTIAAWGDNGDGQVTGLPSYFGVAHPVALAGQILNGVTAISVAGNRTVAIVGSAATLRAQESRGRLILSWPTNLAGFTLQSTSDLTPPVQWIYATGIPDVAVDQFTITRTLSSGHQLFRLKKP